MGVSCAMFGAEEAALKYFQMSYKVRKGLSVGEHDEIVSDSLFNMAYVYGKNIFPIYFIAILTFFKLKWVYSLILLIATKNA